MGSRRIQGRLAVDGLQVRSHLTLPVTESHDSTYTVLDNDVIIAVTRSAHGTSAITIPTAGMWAGRVLIFDDAGLNANNQTITISTEGSEDIDGGDTATITTAGGSVRLYSDGSNWFTF